MAKNWQDDYQDVWSFWGDDPIGGLDYGYSEGSGTGFTTRIWGS